MGCSLSFRRVLTVKVLALAALALQSAGCADPVAPAAEATPPVLERASAASLGVFREVCGRVGEATEDALAGAIEARGFRPVRPEDAAPFLSGRPGGVWSRGAAGDNVSVALQREGTECTVTVQRADVDLALNGFTQHLLDQAGPGRSVARIGDRRLVEGGMAVRQLLFRVTSAQSAQPILYIASGTSSPEAAAQLFLRARLDRP